MTNDTRRARDTQSWRWRLRRAAVVGVVGALAAGAWGITQPGAAQAHSGNSGHHSGWDDDEFDVLNTTSAVRRAEVRSIIESDTAAWHGAKGAGVDVALVDTGVAPVVGLDRATQVVNGPDLSLDHQSGVTPGLDAFGHGTHMASLIAGSGGMAPRARLVNLKVGSSDGAVDVSQLIAAIDWAVQHRRDPGMNIRVLNLSAGTESAQDYQVDPLAHAVESAWRNGIVVVVAAGNSGGALVDPAVDPYVLTVGAADTADPNRDGDDSVAAFSSVGTPARGVDVVAPGVSILGLRDPGSTIDLDNPDAVVDGTLFKGSGTSQAAAVVSGAVAQLLSERPDLTPDQVKALITSTARRLERSPVSSQGGGMVDVDRALKAKVSGLPTQSFPVSTGMGSLEAARGDSHLVADDGTVLQGEVDLQGAPWIPSVWAPRATAGVAWDGGTWNGSPWTGSDWAADGTYGSMFLGRTWRSELWSGRTWRADVWLRSTWRGRTWRDGAWA